MGCTPVKGPKGGRGGPEGEKWEGGGGKGTAERKLKQQGEDQGGERFRRKTSLSKKEEIFEGREKERIVGMYAD